MQAAKPQPNIDEGVAQRFLSEERRVLEQFIPGLDGRLKSIPFAELEKPNNPAIAIYRELKGPCLLIPAKHGGLGANPLEAVSIHRAIAARAPSLAVAVTMHNFSVATLVEYSFYGDYSDSFLKTVSSNQLFLASGFAEGRAGANIMIPTVRADRVDGGYKVNGSKKPCSLTHSMDLLTASVAVPGNGNGDLRAVAIIPADAEGIGRKPFWNNWVLAGAESDELILKDVFVPEEYLFFPETQEVLDKVETGGFLWFELLITASYLGIASSLAERALVNCKGPAADRAMPAIELEGAASALEGIAHSMTVGKRDDSMLARCLAVRYAIQGMIERAAALSAELLGGIAFVSSSEVSYLLAASRALAYHPPSRVGMAPTLCNYFLDGSFRMI
ncbi:MAG TPA: acyl-CoA dehydrogenase family protein [Candidatus Angelobacter sp.]|nr:acyl-CoA dehydrogenase family protein [Candidatus Angelobacter sp.]